METFNVESAFQQLLKQNEQLWEMLQELTAAQEKAQAAQEKAQAQLMREFKLVNEKLNRIEANTIVIKNTRKL